MRISTLFCCFALLVGCQDAAPASQAAPAAAAADSKAVAPSDKPAFARDAFKAPPAAPIEGEPVDEQRLLPLLPDQIEGFVADGPATSRRVSVPNGGALTTAKRTYKKDAAALEIEIIDSLHSPNIRSIVKLSGQIEANTATVVRKPEKLGEHLAIAQWHQATNMARIGVLVADRLIVNVNVNPAASPEPGLVVARKIDWAPIAKLAADAAAEDKARPKAAAPAGGAAPGATAAPGAAEAPAAAAPASAAPANAVPAAAQPSSTTAPAAPAAAK